MGKIANRGSGPDYRQEEVPVDKTTGNLWFSSRGGNCSMSNGISYGGEPKRVGIAGYSGIGHPTVKLTYYTETASSVASITGLVYNACATQNLSAGYFMGGSNDLVGGTANKNLRKLTFHDEVITAPISKMVVARGGYPAACASSLAAYAIGGYDSGLLASIEKLLFFSENFATNTSSLPFGLYYLCNTQSQAAGYTMGGWGGGSTTRIIRLLFGTESTGLVTSSLSLGRELGQGLTSDVAGYCAGGGSPISGVYHSRVDKMMFGNETTQLLASTLTVQRGRAGSPSSYVAGYSISGATAGNISLTSIERLFFSVDNSSNIASSIFSSVAWTPAVTNLNQPVGGTA